MEKITSMTEEEFSKAAREVGWTEDWIQDVIKEARIDADTERAQKRGIIAISVPMRLAMHWAFCKYGPTYPEVLIA